MPGAVAYTVDDARWPLVVVRASPVANETAALDAGYRKLEAILSRKQPFAVLFDMRGASSSSARRRRLHEWGQHHADALTRFLVVGAIVASSNLERGFVTATLWVRTPPWPMRVFPDAPEAEEWLVAEFSALMSANKPQP